MLFKWVMLQLHSYTHRIDNYLLPWTLQNLGCTTTVVSVARLRMGSLQNGYDHITHALRLGRDGTLLCQGSNNWPGDHRDLMRKWRLRARSSSWLFGIASALHWRLRTIIQQWQDSEDNFDKGTTALVSPFSVPFTVRFFRSILSPAKKHTTRTWRWLITFVSRTIPSQCHLIYLERSSIIRTFDRN
jgi:hypothetical protein